MTKRNNQKNSTISKPLLFLFAVIIISSLSCYLPNDRETEENYEKYSYSFDTATILGALERERIYVFSQLEPTPPAMFYESSGKVNWSQEDYFRVIRALYQYAWQTPLEQQNIYRLSFSLHCPDIVQGHFSGGLIYTYNGFQKNGVESRKQYQTDISPADGLVFTRRGDYTPNINREKPLNLRDYRISVDEALKIAEKNGGAEKRQEYNNDCEIHASTPDTNGNKVWDVTYSTNKEGFWYIFYQIAIDPQNGSSRLLVP